VIGAVEKKRLFEGLRYFRGFLGSSRANQGFGTDSVQPWDNSEAHYLAFDEEEPILLGLGLIPSITPQFFGFGYNSLVMPGEYTMIITWCFIQNLTQKARIVGATIPRPTIFQNLGQKSADESDWCTISLECYRLILLILMATRPYCLDSLWFLWLQLWSLIFQARGWAFGSWFLYCGYCSYPWWRGLRRHCMRMGKCFESEILLLTSLPALKLSERNTPLRSHLYAMGVVLGGLLMGAWWWIWGQEFI